MESLKCASLVLHIPYTLERIRYLRSPFAIIENFLGKTN